MNVSGEYDQLIFSHIPKCGGTSFREYIYRQALSSGLHKSQLHIPGVGGLSINKNLNQLSKIELDGLSQREVKVWAMHVPINMHQHYKLLGSNPLYFTLVRSPLDRFLSHYYFFYYRQGADGFKGKHLQDLSDSSLNYIFEKLSNIYASYFLGEYKSGVFKDIQLFEEIVSVINQDNIVVGLLDDINGSLDKLRGKLPRWLNVNNDFPKTNVFLKSKSYAKDLSSNLKDQILSKNQLDILIYNYIKDKF